MFDGQIFEHEGVRFQFETHHDDSLGPPWKEHDGHGPVSDWTTRAKRPGEMVLNKSPGSRRYYDFQEAVRIAKRDGWDTPPYQTGTRGDRAHRAALADFHHLRRWCNDQWSWIGVIITLVDDDGNPLPDFRQSLWGIESEAGDYLTEVAHELADEIIGQWEKLGNALVS